MSVVLPCYGLLCCGVALQAVARKLPVNATHPRSSLSLPLYTIVGTSSSLHHSRKPAYSRRSVLLKVPGLDQISALEGADLLSCSKEGSPRVILGRLFPIPYLLFCDGGGSAPGLHGLFMASRGPAAVGG